MSVVLVVAQTRKGSCQQEDPVTVKDEPRVETTNNTTLVDTDNDTIPDILDSCKDQPETVNNYMDSDGCPDEKPNYANLTEEQQLVEYTRSTKEKVDRQNLEQFRSLWEENPDLALVLISRIVQIKQESVLRTVPK